MMRGRESRQPGGMAAAEGPERAEVKAEKKEVKCAESGNAG
jgi:hypothetical protein